MENILLKYMTERFERTTSAMAEPMIRGPVVTISRQAGCPGKDVAEVLCRLLRQEQVGPTPAKWRLVSKEILDAAAEALGTSAQKIQYVFHADYKGVMDEMVQAFSGRHYISDLKARRTIKQVINALASEGSIIILGMAGVAILPDLPGSLHVKLVAPLDWRAAGIAQRKKMSMTQALEFIKNEDQVREKVSRSFGLTKPVNEAFHVVFNCAGLSSEEMASALLPLVRNRVVTSDG